MRILCAHYRVWSFRRFVYLTLCFGEIKLTHTVQPTLLLHGCAHLSFSRADLASSNLFRAGEALVPLRNANMLAGLGSRCLLDSNVTAAVCLA